MEAITRRSLARTSPAECADAHRLARALAHPRAFERAHLRSYFDGGVRAPVLLLHAPSGYGKTTALARLARHAGESVRWATLTSRDAELGSFVATVMSAMYGWGVGRPPVGTEPRDAAQLILGAVEELGVSTLVLDDFSFVSASEPVDALLQSLAERVKGRAVVAVATEEVPDFARKLRLRQLVIELDKSDLRFDADDVATYLRDFHHYEVDDRTAASIARRGDGCAAVVNLVGQLVNDLPKYLRVDFEALPLGTSDQHLAPLLREALARAGVRPAHASRALAGVDVALADGPSPADALLDTLSSRHCLAQAYATEPATVVPHALLRRLAPLL